MIATNKFAHRWGTGNIPVDIFMRVKEFSDDSHPDPSQRIHLLVNTVSSDKISIDEGPWLKAHSDDEWSVVNCRVVCSTKL